MIGELFRARAAQLERDGRSRLYVELMRGAADDADAEGIVATVFAGDPATRGSMPELRLLAHAGYHGPPVVWHSTDPAGGDGSR